jgi:predicted amidohydrolase YtcJ
VSLTVFTNAFLIDCTGADPVEGAAVVVEDDRIRDVLPAGKVGPLPGPVTTLDLKGATLMPGLTDAHVHICAVTESMHSRLNIPAPAGVKAATDATVNMRYVIERRSLGFWPKRTRGRWIAQVSQFPRGERRFANAK